MCVRLLPGVDMALTTIANVMRCERVNLIAKIHSADTQVN